MTNWTIYQIVNYLINKEQSGNTFSASEFELILNHNSLKLFKRRLGMPEEYQLQTAYTQQGYANTTRILMDLADFVNIENITYTNGIATIPSRTAYPIGMEYKRTDTSCEDEFTTVLVELVNHGELVIRKTSSLKPISYEYPIYGITNNLNIYPESISTSVFTLLKYPIEAVFVTTTDSNGEEVYDATGSTELEWNDLAKLDIISGILASVGLNLGASEILQTAELYKTKGL